MRAFLTVSLVLLAGETSVIERYETPRINCAVVQAAVEKHGAAVLTRQLSRHEHQ